ncbi:MAG: DUF6174 domain-containing protein [Pirellulales bacterium]|nr:DUF6174 domain-containing protein [Pirellulales bacterium]
MIAPRQKTPQSEEEFLSPALPSADQGRMKPSTTVTEESALESSRGGHSSRPHMKRSQILVGAILGSVVTFLVSVIILIAINSDSLPILTEDRLETAQYLWRNSGIRSYTMTIEIKGARSGTVEIEVEAGKPTKLIRDGAAPPRRTWDAWTIAGQFEMIEQDLANRKNPQNVFGVRESDDISIYGILDDRIGIPRHYRRIVKGQPYEVEWIIKEFTPDRR